MSETNRKVLGMLVALENSRWSSPTTAGPGVVKATVVLEEHDLAVAAALLNDCVFLQAVSPPPRLQQVGYALVATTGANDMRRVIAVSGDRAVLERMLSSRHDAAARSEEYIRKALRLPENHAVDHVTDASWKWVIEETPFLQ